MESRAAQRQPAERVDLLIRTPDRNQATGAVCSSALRDENHRDEALRLGLHADSSGTGESSDGPSAARKRSEDHQVAADRRSRTANTADAFDERLAAEDPLGAYTLLADGLGGFAHLGCRLGRSRLLLELIRRLYPLAAPLSVEDVAWCNRYAQLWWETEALRLTGQLDAALVTNRKAVAVSRRDAAGLWLKQAQIHRLAAAFARFIAGKKAQALSPICRCRRQRRRNRPAWRFWRATRRCVFAPVASAFASAGCRTKRGALAAAAGAHLCAAGAADAGRDSSARWLTDCVDRATETGDTLALAEASVLLPMRCVASGEQRQRPKTIASDPVCKPQRRRQCSSRRVAKARLLMDQASYEAAAAHWAQRSRWPIILSLACYRIDLLNLRGQLRLRRSNPMSAERDARDALAHAMAPGGLSVG